MNVNGQSGQLHGPVGTFVLLDTREASMPAHTACEESCQPARP